MAERRRYSPEIKAAALADLQGGDQPAIVAERYHLDRGVVKMWKQRHVTGDVTDDVTRSVAESQPARVPIRPLTEANRETLAELVQLNLRAKLIATQRIAEHATNPAWLDKQTATELAALFECLDRSAIGILDRLASRERPAPPAADE